MLRFASRKERVESRHLWSGGQELHRVATKKNARGIITTQARDHFYEVT
jgi:hypothetical protein